MFSDLLEFLLTSHNSSNFIIGQKSNQFSSWQLYFFLLSSVLVSCQGEQTYCRNQLLDKVPKTVLGQNVEKKFQN